jgi:hypothetical protein
MNAIHQRRLAPMLSLLVAGVLALATGSICAQSTVAPSPGGQLAVSESGAATYGIPVKLPPGVAGMEPKLALGYSSQGGNGLLGVGWNLEGMSAITRCPRTMSTDGVRGAIAFNSNDRFCMDGQRLMLVGGTYGAPDSEYRTEREGFSRIVAKGSAGSGPAWFEVQNKAGLLLRYGHTMDSRIERQGSASVAVWALTRVQDVKGNYLEWEYVESAADGLWYPKEVRYTGSASAAPTNRVVFNVEARPDRAIAAQAGFKNNLSVRVTSIEAMAGGAPVGRYEFTYSQGPVGGASRLATLRHCSTAPSYQCTENKTFQYTGEPLAFSQAFHVAGDGIGSSKQGIVHADINGDGRSDLLYWYYSTSVGLVLRSKIGDGAGNFTHAEHIAGDGVDGLYGIEVADVNGDGKADIVYWYNDGNRGLVIRTKIGNGSGSFGHQEFYAGDGMTSNYKGVRIADINGDGRSDLIYWFHHSTDGLVIRSKISQGTGQFTEASFVAGDGVSAAYYGVEPADINGDGLADLMYWYYDPVRGLIIRSKIGDGNGAFSHVEHVAGDGMGSQYQAVQVVDINGDGLSDVLYWYYDTSLGLVVRSKIGDGTGRFSEAQTIAGDGMGSTYQAIRVADVNGDGKADLVYWYGDSVRGLVVRYKIGDGLGGFTNHEQVFGDGVGSGVLDILVGDVNGDGKSDLIYWFGGGADGLNIRSKITAGPPVDRLAKVIGTGGQEAEVIYRPLTDAAVYARDTGTDAAAYPRIDLQMPMHVVSEIRSNNGVGGQSVTQYTYGGLKAEQGTGRGMLGFRWTGAKNVNTGIENYTEFRQDWPFTGLASKSETRLAGSGNGGVLKRATTTYAQGPGSASPSTFVYASQSTEESWDLNGTPLPTIMTTSQYGLSPQYGDPTRIQVTLSDGSTKTTVNEYWPAETTNGKWILGRLKKATVTSQKP